MAMKLGNHLSAERNNNRITIYKNGVFLKNIDINNAFERRYLIVELVLHMNAQPYNVAKALDISPQTVYNVTDAYKKFGSAGLIDNSRRGSGNKARIFEEQRKQKA